MQKEGLIGLETNRAGLSLAEVIGPFFFAHARTKASPLEKLLS